MIGKSLLHCGIQAKIGAGGMGEVGGEPVLLIEGGARLP